MKNVADVLPFILGFLGSSIVSLRQAIEIKLVLSLFFRVSYLPLAKNMLEELVDLLKHLNW